MSAEPNSVRADLEAAMKQHADPPAVETPEVEKPVAVESAEPAHKVDAHGRVHGEGGKFVAKEKAADSGDGASVREAPKQPAAGVDTGKPAAAGPELVGDTKGNGEAGALAPPNGWSAQAKAVWHTLPKDVQEAAVQREKDVAKFTSTRDEHASFGKEVYQTVQPYLAQIQAEGGTPVAAIKSLLNTAYVLRTGTPERKRELLLQTAQQFGVDLGVKPNGQQPQNTGDPAFASLQSEIVALKNELAQIKGSGEQQLLAEVTTELQAFAADPSHPHYESVKGHMAALMEHGLAKDLQDAYDQAVYARPDTRATLEAQKRAEEEQKRIAEAKAKADAAKRRAVSVTGGPGNTAAASAPASKGSIRDDLLAAREALSGAV